MSDNYKNMKITVVCGGVSSEREVSLRSGKAVSEALVEAGFSGVSLFDLKEDNLACLIEQKPDLCFLALHGKGGEDGSIQGALSLCGIKYTFSGLAASSAAMDKITAKRIFLAENIPTAPFVAVSKDDFASFSEISEYLKENIGLPMVLKAPLEGSSIGVVMVHSASVLEDAIKEVFGYGDTLLAEKFLSGKEITVPVMGNGKGVALPVIEITSENEFYDFESKYTPGMCHHIIPARISEEESEKASRIAEKVYRVMGCRGLARIDLIIDEKAGPCVLEVNTIPGMTSMSLVPDSARAAGITFPELCKKLVELALE